MGGDAPVKAPEGTEKTEGELHWLRVLFQTYMQVLGIYGLVLVCTEARLVTILYCCVLIFLGVIGVNAGAHRLWAHNSYTANAGLKVFLMLCHTLTGQGTIYNWVRYHRLHHKHIGTDQDPFNANYGFLYSHVVSNLQKDPPSQKKLLKAIDMSDVKSDEVVMFQKKYYWILYLVVFLFLPLYIPFACWKESITSIVFVVGITRYAITLHFAWLIHSGALLFGLKKGEKYPSDTNIVFLWYKTYWLKYHYLAPWDYQTGEYGKYGNDVITVFIRVCAALELATDLRTADSKTVQNALYMSMDTNKPISECLLEIEANANIPKDHYLNPKKYY